MRCGYEVVAYLNVIITGSDFIACKEQMATLAALTHHSVCLPGSAAPVGAGAFVLKTQTQAGLQPCRYVPGHSCVLRRLLRPVSLLVGNGRPETKSWGRGPGLGDSEGAGMISKGKRRIRRQELCLQHSGGWQKWLAQARDGTQLHTGA